MRLGVFCAANSHGFCSYLWKGALEREVLGINILANISSILNSGFEEVLELLILVIFL